jgi:hypothetical protein
MFVPQDAYSQTLRHALDSRSRGKGQEGWRVVGISHLSTLMASTHATARRCLPLTSSIGCCGMCRVQERNKHPRISGTGHNCRIFIVLRIIRMVIFRDNPKDKSSNCSTIKCALIVLLVISKQHRLPRLNKAKQFNPFPLSLGMKTSSPLNCQAYGTHGSNDTRLSSP